MNRLSTAAVVPLGMRYRIPRLAPQRTKRKSSYHMHVLVRLTAVPHACTCVAFACSIKIREQLYNPKHACHSCIVPNPKGIPGTW